MRIRRSQWLGGNEIGSGVKKGNNGREFVERTITVDSRMRSAKCSHVV